MSKGTAIITVTTNDGGFKATCTVTVWEYADVEPEVEVEGGKAEVDTEDAVAKIDEAVEEGYVPEVKIDVSTSVGVSEIAVSPTVVEKLSDIANSSLTVTTGTGTVVLPQEALSKLDLTSGEIGISIEEVDVPSEYSDLGITAVYSLIVSYDGTVRPVQFGTEVNARMPYIPAPGEDTSSLKVYYLAGEGQVEIVDGYYEDGFVYFTTTHFSEYAVLPYKAVTSVTLDRTSATIGIGETVKLTVTVTPSDATFGTVTWTTSDASIATVTADGTVTAIKAGTVTIKAAAEGKEAVCTVTVAAPTYTVTFDANGGFCPVPSMETGADGKLAYLPDATRDKYSFDGWYTQATGGQKISTSYKFTDDTTVYAHWTESPSPGPTPSSRGGFPVIAIIGAVIAIIAVAGVVVFMKKR